LNLKIMRISPARVTAFDVLLAVEKKDAYASELLHSETYRNLGNADHRLATEIVMGVLRWRSVLDQYISAQSSQGLKKLDVEVLIALRIGVYQLYFLERVPARAVLHDSVELIKKARKRSAAPFVNAVLRKIQNAPRTKVAIAQGKDAGEISQSSAHPSWLIERWIKQFGVEASRVLCAYDQQIPETAIRMFHSSVSVELEEAGIKLASGKLLHSASRVVSGDITKTKAFRDGRVAIQDEASQLVALLVGNGKHILDCCAAPGGKTRIIADRNLQAEILALELHEHRAALLRKMAPNKNIEVKTADATQFSTQNRFDRILADVPCSGTGTLARNPEIKWRLTPDDLPDLQSRQLAILRAAMRQLASGGKLIYSTCSLEEEENSVVVEAVLSQEPGFQLVPAKEELARLQREGELIWPHISSLTQGDYMRTVPGIHPCDGFFAAVITRN
jgi:16S rRNA (cytosine967-C5)-methyltransferase